MSIISKTWLRRLLVVAITPFLLSVVACAGPSGPRTDVLTLDVAAARVACQGAFSQECYSVRQPSTTNWTLFYDTIEGFDYQSGFEYTIRVERRSVPNPPADGSSFSYRLLAVLRKVPA